MIEQQAVLFIFLFSLMFFALGYFVGSEKQKQKANKRKLEMLKEWKKYVGIWFDEAPKVVGGRLGISEGDIVFDRSHTETLLLKATNMIGEPYE